MEARDQTERAPTTEPPQERAPEQRAHEPAIEHRAAGNGMNQYWERFEAIQARFIDEPRSAVQSAQKLVEEAVDRMMEGLRHTGTGDRADTEELRVTMKRYRDLLQQLTGGATTPSAATPSAGYAGTSPHRGDEPRTSPSPPPSEPTRRA